MIKLTTIKNGRATYLLRDEEAYIVATAEMDGANGLPKDTNSLINELQQVLYCVFIRNIINNITSKSAIYYIRKVTRYIN